MAREISLYDLERISKRFNLRIWQCKRIGRRWSFLSGVGEEKVLPAKLIYEDDETGIFIQSDEDPPYELLQELKNLLAEPSLPC